MIYLFHTEEVLETKENKANTDDFMIKDCFWKDDIQVDAKGCKDNHKIGAIEGRICICQDDLCEN